MSFVDKISSNNAGAIFTLTGFGIGSKKAWYVLSVDKIKVPLFIKAAKAGNVLNLESFGKILHSGFGNSPPDELIDRIINPVKL